MNFKAQVLEFMDECIAEWVSNKRVYLMTKAPSSRWNEEQLLLALCAIMLIIKLVFLYVFPRLTAAFDAMFLFILQVMMCIMVLVCI